MSRSEHSAGKARHTCLGLLLGVMTWMEGLVQGSRRRLPWRGADRESIREARESGQSRVCLGIGKRRCDREHGVRLGSRCVGQVEARDLGGRPYMIHSGTRTCPLGSRGTAEGVERVHVLWPLFSQKVVSKVIYG